MIIKRNLPDDGKQTTGKVDLSDMGIKFFADTMERAWKDNEHGDSCIPAGTYTCTKVPASSHINYPHIAVENVPNRAGICIHRGNFFSDSLGCILIGKGYSDINGDGEKDVLASTPTYQEMYDLLPDEFTLTIG